MSKDKDLELLATFIWPENYEKLCVELQNSGIEFFIEDEPTSRDPLFPEVFGNSSIYVFEDDIKKAFAVKEALKDKKE